MSLSKDAILNARDAIVEEVNVARWWGDVAHVRGMSGGGRDRLENMIQKARTNGQANADRVTFPDMRSFVAVNCLCDEAGDFLFDEGDIPAMSAKDSGPLDLIFEAGCRLSGITEGEVDKIADLSQTGASADSGSN